VPNDDTKAPKGTPVWRDPVGLGFRAHRNVLLLRLRWHASAAKRRPPRRSRRGPDSPR
jgi:hypothetical protein